MGWQPARFTPAQLEERRLAAGRLLRAKRQSQAAIARELGVSRAAVTHWKRRLEQQGPRGLRWRRPTGRPSRLTPAQWHHLIRLLERGAVAAGFETERWSQSNCSIRGRPTRWEARGACRLARRLVGDA